MESSHTAIQSGSECLGLRTSPRGPALEGPEPLAVMNAFPITLNPKSVPSCDSRDSGDGTTRRRQNQRQHQRLKSDGGGVFRTVKLIAAAAFKRAGNSNIRSKKEDVVIAK